MKVDWFLRIGLQDKDHIICIDWFEGIQKELLSDECSEVKKEIIEILKNTIKFMKIKE